MIDKTVLFAILAFIPWMAFAYTVNKFRNAKRNIGEDSLTLELLHIFINFSVLAFNIIGAFVCFRWVGGLFFG